MKVYFPIITGQGIVFTVVCEENLDSMEGGGLLSSAQGALIRKIISEEDDESIIILVMVDGDGILHCIVQNKDVMLKTREIDIDGEMKMGKEDNLDEMWYKLTIKILIASGKVPEDIVED